MVIHYVTSMTSRAMCSTKDAVCWVSDDLTKVTCERCAELRRLQVVVLAARLIPFNGHA